MEWSESIYTEVKEWIEGTRIDSEFNPDFVSHIALVAVFSPPPWKAYNHDCHLLFVIKAVQGHKMRLGEVEFSGNVSIAFNT